MIQFKNLLTEQNHVYKLRDLLNNEYHMGNDLLVRGSNVEIDLFKEREIRKDRKPRDTIKLADAIIDGIEDGFYPDVPKRSQSKFAATDDNIDEVQQYGDFVYYCFPHKSAKIVSLEHDSLQYFEDMRGLTTFVLKNFLGEFSHQKVPNTHAFMAAIFDAKNHGDLNSLYNHARRNWDEVVYELNNIDQADFDQQQEDLFWDVSFRLEQIQNYFEDMKSGIQPNSKEVIFDGPKYLIVNRRFFRYEF